jgi:hypothetical protein
MDTTKEQILTAAAAGAFNIGGDLTVNRMGYGAMQITGAGVWGPPVDHLLPFRLFDVRLNSALT